MNLTLSGKTKTYAAGLFLFFLGTAAAGEPQTHRTIPIPKREHGYNNFESTAIQTKLAWDEFEKKHLGEKATGWNKRKEVAMALADANIDFKKEALILLRHTEGSGSTSVTFEKPVLKGKRLVCTITRKVPEVGTADMAYYSFAVVVQKSAINEIELQIKGRKPTILKINGGQ